MLFKISFLLYQCKLHLLNHIVDWWVQVTALIAGSFLIWWFQYTRNCQQNHNLNSKIPEMLHGNQGHFLYSLYNNYSCINDIPQSRPNKNIYKFTYITFQVVLACASYHTEFNSKHKIII